ncbi:MAG: 4Fe-4S dicluster domain-containing protein [Candidatus Thalassarchaeaceae archaeon]|nr:4Fe-4S dicluster domain-containing protein [Candidatus Thalassarchaeaceae archaeon]
MVNYGFVIDNRTCIGCHACTVACKSEHDVPIGVNRTHVKYIETGTYPDSSREFSVHRCNHCADSPCTTICPTTALFTRNDGIVDFDDDRCIGCKSCMQACPYDALYIDPNQGTAAKCNYCAHRIENSYEPACVIVCPTESIVSGDLDDSNSRISQIVATHDVKVRKPEAGTKPNLYYVETSDEMLDPSASEVTGTGVWTEQAFGVGHFAKYAESRLEQADTPSMIVQLALEKKAKSASPRDQAIIRDVMSKLSDDSPKAKRVYDQPSKGILWGWEVSAYLTTKALATGPYMVFMLLALTIGIAPKVMLGGFLLLSLAMLSLTGILLIIDLDRPERFLYVLLRPNWSSWLVKGAYLLLGYGAVISLHLVGLFMDASWTFHVNLAILGIPLAWMSGIYTGFLLRQGKARQEWSDKSTFEISLEHTLMLIAVAVGVFMIGTPLLANTFDVTAFLVTVVGVGLLILTSYVNHREIIEPQMEPLL